MVEEPQQESSITLPKNLKKLLMLESETKKDPKKKKPKKKKKKKKLKMMVMMMLLFSPTIISLNSLKNPLMLGSLNSMLLGVDTVKI